MEGINAPLPAVPAADTAAFDVAAFDGRRRLQEIHELLTSFLDYQSHIQSHAAMALPPTVLRPSEEQCCAIVNLLREENTNFEILQDLIGVIKKDNKRLIKKYDDRLAAWDSRKRLEITLITDGDSSRIRYHSPSPYVLSPTSTSRFTIQVKQFNSFITFSQSETKTITMST